MPVRCSHPDCREEAVGSQRRRTIHMNAPGFYPYCEIHAPVGDFVRYDELRSLIVDEWRWSKVQSHDWRWEGVESHAERR